MLFSIMAIGFFAAVTAVPVNTTILQMALARNRNIENQMRTMPHDWLLEVFSLMVSQEELSPIERSFVNAFEDKANNDGLPPLLHQAVLNFVTVGDYAYSKGETSDRSDSCPAGGCNVPIYLSQIWDYGCWCNFGDDLLEGVSAPKNEYDAVCQRMQRCLRCAQLDAVEAGDNCDVKTETYNAAFGFSSSSQGMNANCESQNQGNDCATHLCSCQLNMISEIISLLWNATPFESSFKHSNGFNPVAECRGEEHEASEQSCCGFYPGRFPYNLDSQSCCDNSPVPIVFNHLTHVCCADGSILAAGEC